MNRMGIIIFLVLIRIVSPAQEVDLLSLLKEDEPEAERVKGAFKSTRVIMAHSTEMMAGGVLDFRILHRFGRVNLGFYEMFGLDQASIRLGLDYALSDRFTIGIGRSNIRKESDGFLKTRLLWQTTGARSFPFALTLVNGMTIDGLKWQNPEQKNYFTSRLGYYHQLIIARKFNETFTFQLAPTVVHRNLVQLSTQKNDVGALGIGGRIKITSRIALMLDYFYVPDRGSDDFISPLSIGFDIETGGHVFQLHFTNALGMNERAFIIDTTGKWDKGDIHFGFNISRVFTLSTRQRR